MDGLRAGGHRHLLIEAQVSGRGQIDGDAVALEFGGDDAGFGFKGEIASHAGEALDETGEAARAIAAHLPGATVAVVELPGPVRLSGSARDQDHDPVGADASVPLAKARDLVAR